MIVGLTGGIASGKSTVAQLFAELGVGIIDADVVARAVVAPGTQALNAIVAHFGTAVLTPQGTLNRAWLREQIFRNPVERQWLEALLHPLIRDQMIQQAERLTTPYGLMVIPLLKARQDYPILQRVLVVDVPAALQLKRLQARDQVNLVQAQAILNAQLDRTARLALADEVIVNNADLQALRQQVAQLDQQYRAIRAG